jgi:hypothetical protein
MLPTHRNRARRSLNSRAISNLLFWGRDEQRPFTTAERLLETVGAKSRRRCYTFHSEQAVDTMMGAVLVLRDFSRAPAKIPTDCYRQRASTIVKPAASLLARGTQQ